MLIGYALGGEAGARLGERIGIRSSADTVLRTLKQPLVDEGAAPVRVLGVDDWAWRKGQRYGTILVDLNRREPVELLPDRSAGSLKRWLEEHPGVEIVARDRAGVYAQGIRQGAPDAAQVADRFHLLCNLTAAAERALHQKRIKPTCASASEPAPTPKTEDIVSVSQSDRLKVQRREQRRERYNDVVKLYQAGHSQQAISRMPGMERKTVRRFLRAGEFPERAHPKRKPSRLNRFRNYLERRWAEGCHNATQLWREIAEQGYEGGRGMVAQMISSYRQPGTKYFRETEAPRKLRDKRTASSPRQIAGMLARRPETLSQHEDKILRNLLTTDPEVAVTALALGGALAGYLPARRAARVELLHSQ